MSGTTSLFIVFSVCPSCTVTNSANSFYWPIPALIPFSVLLTSNCTTPISSLIWTPVDCSVASVSISITSRTQLFSVIPSKLRLRRALVWFNAYVSSMSELFISTTASAPNPIFPATVSTKEQTNSISCCCQTPEFDHLESLSSWKTSPVDLHTQIMLLSVLPLWNVASANTTSCNFFS